MVSILIILTLAESCFCLNIAKVLETKLKNTNNNNKSNKLQPSFKKLIAADTQFESFLNGYDCSNYLKSQDGKEWQCEMELKKNLPFFCSCSYKYDCSEDPETNDKIDQRRKFVFYFSAYLLKELKIKNKSKNINRGADYQCEIALNREENTNNKVPKDAWKCSILRNKNDTKSKDEEFYCECFYKKTCTKDHIIFI